MRIVGEILFRCLTVVVIIVGIILLGAVVNQFIEKKQDSVTSIEGATVVEKAKTSGTRRSLPRPYLLIQENGKAEPTRVFVDLGTWTWCEVGSIYNDLPGSKGSCELPKFPNFD